MTTIKKGFKLCSLTLTTDLFYSAFSDGIIVKYKVGEWAEKPKKGGPLAVFGDLIDALNFKRRHFERPLLECEYKQSDEKTLYCNILVNGVRVFKERRSDDLPSGTILADEVKIIEEIREEEVKF